MEPLTVGLVQINNTIFGRRYLPYAAGLLQAYALAHAPDPSRYRFLPFVYRRQPVAALAASLAGADVVGFSVYMWSFELSLAVARALKAQSPHTLVVFGGPHVPPRGEAFLREHPFVDVLCHGEGERTFLALLEATPGRRFDDLPGVSYLDGEAFVTRPRGPRVKDLAEIPSPYLSGTFDPLLHAHPGERWLACWETNRGCPFSCTFCDWGQAVASKVVPFDMGRIEGEVRWFADHRIHFIFCCDANFGILPRDLDIARLLADTKARTGFPLEISIQNTKNATERAWAVQHLLSQAGLNKEIALSLQSVDPETLRQIKRSNIRPSHFEALQRRFNAEGAATYTDVVLGLPGETYGSFADGIGEIIDRGQLGRIKFYNLSLLPGAELSSPEERARHGLLTARCRLLNIHGPLEEQVEIPEHQEVVIGTRAMPPEAWVRARALAWMCELTFFDRLLQMPMRLLRQRFSVGYRAQLEALMAADGGAAPTVARIASFFLDKARSIQAGGSEHCEPSRWPGTFFPANNYAFIQLQEAERLGAFDAEAVEILAGLAPGAGAALRAAADLNRSLVPSLRAAEA